ncbi:hypothetical protein Ancab_011808 [Ancistrocladus abbreviatus]
MSSIPPVELWPALQPAILNDLESLDVGRVENIQREGRYTVRIEKALTIPFESLQGELTSVELRHFSLAEKLKGSHFVLGAIRKIELVIEEEHTCVYVYEDFDFTLKETIIDSSYKYLVEEERKGASDCILHVDYLQLLKDYVMGLRESHKAGVVHHNITVENLVVKKVGGKNRGKLRNFLGEARKNKGKGVAGLNWACDYKKLSSVMRYVFQQKYKAMLPQSLWEFLKHMKQVRKPTEYSNVEYHPLFLGPEQRLFYRLLAFCQHIFCQSTEFVKELNRSIKRFQWRKILTQKIKHEELLEVFYYEAEEQNVEVEDGPCSLYDSEVARAPMEEASVNGGCLVSFMGLSR